MSSSSSLMQPCNTETYFSNKMGVYSAEDQSITWTADNGIRIVSYPRGRASVLAFPEYENGLHLTMIIAIAEEALRQDGVGAFSQKITTGTWPFKKSVNWHVFFDPKLTPIVTSFSRYPQVEDNVHAGPFNPEAENDLSTPYNSSLSKSMLTGIGLSLSSFGLPPNSYAVIHKSISDYFSVWNGYYPDWADFANEKYFKPWCEKGEYIEGHTSFSSMIWATVSRYILRIPDADFADHAHVWNTLFQSNKGIAAQGFTKIWYYPKLEAYVLKRIREIKAEYLRNPCLGTNSTLPENIIHYWLRHDTANQVIDKLTSSAWAEALQIAENKGMTLEEMVYLSNFLGVMVGIQENMAFVLTQIAYHFARDRDLLESCRADPNNCIKMVRETLRFMPPAPTSRELRWDTDVIDPDNQFTYRANKGDLFVTIPAVGMHIKEFTTEPQVFDIERPLVHPQAFSAGPHRCPGQMPALHWLYALTRILARYEFSREGLEEPEYDINFILRDGGMKFKISPSQPG